MNIQDTFPDKIDTGELTQKQLDEMEKEAIENDKSNPKLSKKKPYKPYFSARRKKPFVNSARTDKDGVVWVLIKGD